MVGRKVAMSAKENAKNLIEPQRPQRRAFPTNTLGSSKTSLCSLWFNRIFPFAFSFALIASLRLILSSTFALLCAAT